MSRLYVAGPVFEAWRLNEFNDTYGLIERFSERRGWSASLPERRPEIDHLDSESFTRQISNEIRDSQGVVTVLAYGDQSVPVEAAIASFSGKGQIMIVEKPDAIPRLLRGLPGVRDVVPIDDPHRIELAMGTLFGDVSPYA